MELFEVHTENRWEDLIWKEETPASYRGIILSGSPANVLTGDFGKMIFQHAVAPEYAIWLNNYDLQHARTFTARLDFATTELSMLIGNNVLYRLKPIGEVNIKETQFNITYSPFMESRVRFHGLQHYTTFDIHFQQSYFERMAAVYPDELLPFLDKVRPGTPATFYDEHQYATPMMLYVAREILRVLSCENRDSLKLDLLVELLFIEAVTCRKKAGPSGYSAHAGERDMIRHITTLILSDTSHIKTIGELAREAGMNAKKLKYLFKQENGAGIYTYWQLYRLEKSREMVLNHHETPLKEIAHTFGFSDVHSFSKAFKKHYHNAPSHFRKK